MVLLLLAAEKESVPSAHELDNDMDHYFPYLRSSDGAVAHCKPGLGKSGANQRAPPRSDA